jgi:hypothetical protein
MNTMTPRKKKTEAGTEPAEGKRHRHMVGVDPIIHQQLKKLAEQNGRPLTWEIRRILIQRLEEAGLWPPKDD